MSLIRFTGLAAAVAVALSASPSLSAAASTAYGLTSVAWADRFVPTEGVPYDDPAELTITMGQGQIRGDDGLASWSAVNPFAHPGAGLPGPEGRYAAEGQAGYGINRASAQVEATSESGAGRWSAGAYGGAAWYERITVTGSTGTGQLIFQIGIDGVIDIAGPANAQGLSGMAVVGYNLLKSEQPFDFTQDPLLDSGLAFACDAAIGTDCDHDAQRLVSMGSYLKLADSSESIDHLLTVVVPFTYGEAFYVIGAMEVGAYAYQAGASARADFLHTADVLRVLAPDGAVVSLASGAYASYGLPAVPEPGTWALLAAGLVTIVFGAAGRRTSRRA